MIRTRSFELALVGLLSRRRSLRRHRRPAGGRRAASGTALFCRTGDFSRRTGACGRVERRYLDGAGGWRRCAAADRPRGQRVAAHVLARRHSARVHLGSHRRRRHLRADARHRGAGADYVRRWAGPAGRMVTRWRLDLLLIVEPRHRGHARHLPRSRRRGDARWPSAPIATRASSSRPPPPTDDAWRSAPAGTASASGGATAARISTNRSSGCCTTGISRSTSS